MIEPHILILTGLIIIVGGFAGYINSLRNIRSKEKTKTIRFIFSGVGAAILVPLFLNMLSSDLIKFANDYDQINYFVFAGFCFIAGYFSDKFIDSIGDKLLKELQQTKEKVDSTSDKLEKTTREFQESNDIVNALIENETEVDDIDLNQIDLETVVDQTTIEDDSMATQINNVLNAFNGRYKFRTTKGIAKQLNYTETMVDIVLNALEKQGFMRKLSTDKSKELWALSKLGQSLRSKGPN